jgi:hypothetical protein
MCQLSPESLIEGTHELQRAVSDKQHCSLSLLQLLGSQGASERSAHRPANSAPEDLGDIGRVRWEGNVQETEGRSTSFRNDDV